MKYVYEAIKSYFKFNFKEYLKRYAIAEVDDLNKEIAKEYEYIRQLETRRNKAETLAFMELRG